MYSSESEKNRPTFVLHLHEAKAAEPKSIKKEKYAEFSMKYFFRMPILEYMKTQYMYR
jgi:hypothetical protein